MRMPEELEEYTGEYIDDRAVRRGRMSSVPIVTVLLIIINVVVFIYVEMTGSSEDTQHIFDMGASYAPAILEDHEYYRLITHFFLHFGVAHITNNMLSLLVLGYATENAVGHVRFAVIYMFADIQSIYTGRSRSRMRRVGSDIRSGGCAVGTGDPRKQRKTRDRSNTVCYISGAQFIQRICRSLY